MCSHVRSGSTLLGEAIFGAGGWGIPLEYFHVGFRPKFVELWGARELQEYLINLYRRRTEPSGCLSVKLFWRDVVELAAERDPENFGDPAVLTGKIEDAATYRKLFELLCGIFPNPTIIHLTRRNRLRQAISGVTAVTENRWRKFDTTPASAKSADEIYDSAWFVRAVMSSTMSDNHWNAFFDANNLSPFRIVYEDFVQDYAGTLQRLFAHLGRPDAKIVEPRLQRQSDERNEEMYERFLAERADMFRKKREETGG